ncbi:MAG TPA: hypothetical protein DEE98_06690 [Elusimicrobia bacterium]|nr:MAG: hypothetical protein A2278_06800 [Elusimicrobia bacterium RIFOXYA12_FULL_49_49]OGS08662.1 MAG: hypothetical protein A2204_03405 [Elusimicrobia bacterium RIFOXYA1_FULL_47_7]OGS16248.1 MAG: hypothetical protein A2251_01385 [Elusimicrobia bacterium RIFOXYA2_FULL_47_53]OGS26209.1 MAG: hypothetical protein A2339_02710 [Elusimicrobia bacterium RIFOXYB12_FULL_50_12]OGS31403.1 MAG: hypothetical protein A2323_09675 [Elusimicrobia bacterium RIFOXYB2_FULL_46_23]HBU70058.1 hypothetical protein [El
MLLKEKIKNYWHKLLHSNDSPHKVALGFSVGAFLGVFPTFGAGTVLAVALCAVFRLNYVSAIAGSFIVMNPLTTPFFWGLSALAGGLIFSRDSKMIIEAVRNGHFYGEIGSITMIYLTGSMVVSLFVAAASYPAVKTIMLKSRNLIKS